MQDPDRLLTRRDRATLAAVLCALSALILVCSACDLAPPPKHPAAAPAPKTTVAKVSHIPASDVFARQQDMIKLELEDWPGVTVSDVFWKPCDEENSYYLPDKQAIELCTEMERWPGAAVIFAAHEAGHAIAYQLAGTIDEESADEIAAIELVKHGKVQEIHDAVAYYRSQKQLLHMRDDGHPGNELRAWLFECMLQGSEAADGECHDFYEGTRIRWERRLKDPQTAPAATDDVDLEKLLQPLLTPRTPVPQE